MKLGLADVPLADLLTTYRILRRACMHPRNAPQDALAARDALRALACTIVEREHPEVCDA